MQEKYRKVIVFTPMTMLEEESVEKERYHEMMLHEIFPDTIWMEYEEYQKTGNLSESPIYKHAIHPRASYISFELGFSVLYETETCLMCYIGDFITDEMIQYINQNYSTGKEYISLGTFLTKEDATREYYEIESFKENYPEKFHEMLELLEAKQALSQAGRKR